jgi:hypothetical protein
MNNLEACLLAASGPSPNKKETFDNLLNAANDLDDRRLQKALGQALRCLEPPLNKKKIKDGNELLWVLQATSRSDARPHLHRAYADPVIKQLVATDGHRVHIATGVPSPYHGQFLDRIGPTWVADKKTKFPDYTLVLPIADNLSTNIVTRDYFKPSKNASMVGFELPQGPKGGWIWFNKSYVDDAFRGVQYFKLFVPLSTMDVLYMETPDGSRKVVIAPMRDD